MSAPNSVLEIKNKNVGHRARLRERFRRSGFEGLSEHEVLELILTLCIPRCDVKPQAKALLEQFKSLRNVMEAPIEEIESIPGIGESAATGFKIIKESVSLYLQECAQGTVILNSTDRLEQFWRVRLCGLKYEVLEVAYLDHAYKLQDKGVERLEVGIENMTQVYPRKVMQAALKANSTAIVLAHNHPAGDHSPSDHDIQLTKAIVQAGASVGVRLLDHLIFAKNDIFSFKRAGML